MAFEEIKQGLARYEKKLHFGHWINGYVDFVCSECQAHSHRREDVCPKYKARMDSEAKC